MRTETRGAVWSSLSKMKMFPNSKWALWLGSPLPQQCEEQMEAEWRNCWNLLKGEKPARLTVRDTTSLKILQTSTLSTNWDLSLFSYEEEQESKCLWKVETPFVPIETAGFAAIVRYRLLKSRREDNDPRAHISPALSWWRWLSVWALS